VAETLKQFESIGNLVRQDEVASDKLFKAMANYYNVALLYHPSTNGQKLQNWIVKLNTRRNTPVGFRKRKRFCIPLTKREKPSPP
jgi:hypothetical protein